MSLDFIGHQLARQSCRAQQKTPGNTPWGRMATAIRADAPKNTATTFFHPDFTVGSGFSPDLSPAIGKRLAGSTSQVLPPIGNWHTGHRPITPHPAPKVLNIQLC